MSGQSEDRSTTNTPGKRARPPNIKALLVENNYIKPFPVPVPGLPLPAVTHHTCQQCPSNKGTRWKITTSGSNIKQHFLGASAMSLALTSLTTGSQRRKVTFPPPPPLPSLSPLSPNPSPVTHRHYAFLSREISVCTVHRSVPPRFSRSPSPTVRQTRLHEFSKVASRLEYLLSLPAAARFDQALADFFLATRSEAFRNLLSSIDPALSCLRN